jgi:hypothetical protein
MKRQIYGIQYTVGKTIKRISPADDLEYLLIEFIDGTRLKVKAKYDDKYNYPFIYWDIYHLNDDEAGGENGLESNY